MSEHSEAHPHCTLTLSRCLAPDHNWCWSVTFPDGQIFDTSKGGMSFVQALADMQLNGAHALVEADTRWRQTAGDRS